MKQIAEQQPGKATTLIKAFCSDFVVREVDQNGNARRISSYKDPL